jgi:glucosamine 6-phosphate synthetase-like amidotransferase/phosphosugar isomerase protein
MCGIYGVFNGSSSPINRELLHHVAEIGSSRGADACGIAALIDNQIVVRKSTGCFANHPELLADLDSAKIVIGIGRLATSGDYSLEAAQPVHYDDVALVHNGVVPDYLMIAAQLKYNLETGCDSELIARIIEDAPGTAEERFARALNCTVYATPHAILAIVARVLVISVKTLPVYHRTYRSQTYLCSRSFHPYCRRVRSNIIAQFN